MMGREALHITPPRVLEAATTGTLEVSIKIFFFFVVFELPPACPLDRPDPPAALRARVERAWAGIQLFGAGGARV